MNDIQKILGERIRNLRNQRGWSQEELAHIAEISPSHMGRLERGERSATITSLGKVIGAFDITFEEFFQSLSAIPEVSDDKIILYHLMAELSKRSPKDQEIILNLIKVLPPWNEKK